MDISRKITKYTKKLNRTNNRRKMDVYQQKLKYYRSFAKHRSFTGGAKTYSRTDAYDKISDDVGKLVESVDDLTVSSEELRKKLLEKTDDLKKVEEEHGVKLENIKKDYESKMKIAEQKYGTVSEEEREKIMSEITEQHKAEIDKLKSQVQEFSVISEKVTAMGAEDTEDLNKFLKKILGILGPGEEYVIDINSSKYPSIEQKPEVVPEVVPEAVPEAVPEEGVPLAPPIGLLGKKISDISPEDVDKLDSAAYDEYVTLYEKYITSKIEELSSADPLKLAPIKLKIDAIIDNLKKAKTDTTISKSALVSKIKEFLKEAQAGGYGRACSLPPMPLCTECEKQSGGDDISDDIREQLLSVNRQFGGDDISDDIREQLLSVNRQFGGDAISDDIREQLLSVNKYSRGLKGGCNGACSIPPLI